MRKKLDELHDAYERVQHARTCFEQAARALQEGSADFSKLARALDELNMAQKLFSDAATKVVKFQG